MSTGNITNTLACYVPTFHAKSEVDSSRIISRCYEDLTSKSGWNFRSNNGSSRVRQVCLACNSWGG